MFSGHAAEDLRDGIGPGQQFVDLRVGVSVEDLGDDVGEIELRVDGVELTSLDQ